MNLPAYETLLSDMVDAHVLMVTLPLSATP